MAPMLTSTNAKTVIRFLLFLCCLAANANTSAKDFEFKGRKFGEHPKAQSRYHPWEMEWKELQSSQTNRDYPRIKHISESNKDLLYFGIYPLDEIEYKYFDNLLFEINVQFKQQADCDNMREISEMIEVRYRVAMNRTNNLDALVSEFSNQSISMKITCQNTILDDSPSMKNISIRFQDLFLLKNSENYIRLENAKEIKRKRQEHEINLRQKINF